MAENKYFNSFTDTTTGEKILVEDEETKEKAESLENQVAELNETLTELQDDLANMTLQFSTYDEFLSAIDKFPSTRQLSFCWLSVDATENLTGRSSYSFGFMVKQNNTTFDFFLMVSLGRYIYTGRVQSGAISSFYYYSGTSTNVSNNSDGTT